MTPSSHFCLRKMFLISILFLFSLVLSGISVLPKSYAAEVHREGISDLAWKLEKSKDIFLNNGSVEQEFEILDLDYPNNIPNWAFSNRTRICWSRVVEFKIGETCISIGLGFRLAGENLVGSFDINSPEGVDQKPANSFVTCIKQNQISDVPGTEWMQCSFSQIMEIGSRYRMKLYRDEDLGNDWWQASIQNLRSKQIYEIGSLKIKSADLRKPLKFIWTRVGYQGPGPRTECNSVPVADFLISKVKLNQIPLTFDSFRSGLCTRASVNQNENDSNYFIVKTGGIEPESRTYTIRGTSDFFNTDTNASIPSIINPILKSIKVIGNELRIQVLIGKKNVKKTTNVILLAPELGINENNSKSANIENGVATWRIQLSGKKKGNSIPFYILTKESGQTTGKIESSFEIPNDDALIDSSTTNVKQPKNIQSRITGDTLVITADIQNSEDEKNVFLFSSGLGILKSNPKEGQILSNKAIFEVPLRKEYFGKSIPVSIYLSQNGINSQTASKSISIPLLKVPNFDATPSQNLGKTILCKRGSYKRVFQGNSCPMGWAKSP